MYPISFHLKIAAIKFEAVVTPLLTGQVARLSAADRQLLLKYTSSLHFIFFLCNCRRRDKKTLKNSYINVYVKYIIGVYLIALRTFQLRRRLPPAQKPYENVIVISF